VQTEPDLQGFAWLLRWRSPWILRRGHLIRKQLHN